MHATSSTLHHTCLRPELDHHFGARCAGDGAIKALPAASLCDDAPTGSQPHGDDEQSTEPMTLSIRVRSCRAARHATPARGAAQPVGEGASSHCDHSVSVNVSALWKQRAAARQPVRNQPPPKQPMASEPTVVRQEDAYFEDAYAGEYVSVPSFAIEAPASTVKGCRSCGCCQVRSCHNVLT